MTFWLMAVFPVLQLAINLRTAYVRVLKFDPLTTCIRVTLSGAWESAFYKCPRWFFWLNKVWKPLVYISCRTIRTWQENWQQVFSIFTISWQKNYAEYQDKVESMECTPAAVWAMRTYPKEGAATQSVYLCLWVRWNHEVAEIMRHFYVLKDAMRYLFEIASRNRIRKRVWECYISVNSAQGSDRTQNLTHNKCS